jgi:hypothetical protein
MPGEDGRLAADAGPSRREDDDESFGGESACNIEPPSSGASGWKPIDVRQTKPLMWRGSTTVKIESLHADTSRLIGLDLLVVADSRTQLRSLLLGRGRYPVVRPCSRMRSIRARSRAGICRRPAK